jgi:hypothetical protein
VSDITFAQPERRNYALPILIALAILCVAGGLVYRELSRRVVIASVTHTALHPISIVYKRSPQTGSFRVLANQQGESDLYVIPDVRIENHLTVPLFLKDFTVTMTTADGEMRTAAIEKNDLEIVYSSFPEIKPLMGTPLFRETEIAPGQTAEGTLLAQFQVPQSTWDKRLSASVTVDFYHQDSMTIPIPKP